jgi:hypothetical protein
MTIMYKNDVDKNLLHTFLLNNKKEIVNKVSEVEKKFGAKVECLIICQEDFFTLEVFAKIDERNANFAIGAPNE